MSYLVLARKYRPMFFEDVVGQQHVTATLQNAINKERIANAYLFAGPRGVGKTTVARLLAKALNCEQGPTTHPCNVCSSCTEINESRSLDVFEIDGASNRGIDEVRNLRESLRYSPNPGKHRIYIIDEVHMLTNEAFNALLKTLEEPPSNVLFVFATTEAHKVPPTILSRCQRFDFKRLTNQQIIEQLYSICEKESIDIHKEALRLVAVKADGGMRDAQSILDQIIAFAGMSIQVEDVMGLLGLIDRQLFFDVNKLIQDSDVAGALKLSNRLFSEGLDFKEFLIGLCEHFRNCLIVRTTERSEELDVSEDDRERYLAESKLFEVEDLLRYIKVVSDTENLIRRSSNARLHLEVALVKLVKMSSSIQLSDLLQSLDEVKKKPEILADPSPSLSGNNKTLYDDNKVARLFTPSSAPPLPDQEQTPASDAAVPGPGLELSDLEDQWSELVEAVKKRKIALGSYLHEGWPSRIEGHRLDIMFSPKNGFQKSSVERNIKLVQQVIRERVGLSLRITCVTDTEGVLEKKSKRPVRIDKKEEFKNLLETDDTVKQIVNTFDAEFVK
jgi:DNA polymerase-3 subunit gamma/tau